MLKNRVIPCLLLKNKGLVKTVKFRKPRYVGDPVNAVKIFNDKEVDELMIIDIDATRNREGPDFELIADLASECFMPLCYGGGVRNLFDAERLFSIGVEKVCLQSSAIEDLSTIRDISEKFGSQSVVVSVDVKSSLFGKNKLYYASKKKIINTPWMEFCIKAQEAGAGEIVLNKVDSDGMQLGMDLEIIQEASRLLSVPLIAMGGVGSLNDIKKGIDAGASAIGVGSYFVFKGKHKAVLISYPKYEDLELLFGVNND